MGVANTFGRLLSLLAPYQQVPLSAPATVGDLHELQKHLGVSLPPGLLAAYGICDGSAWCDDALARNLFYSYRFMSVAEVRAQWDLRAGSMQLNAILDPVPSRPPSAVQEVYMANGWVPFAHDGAGGNLAIDYAPGPAGKVGQIINYGRDDRAHFQLAEDFDGFIERVVRDYENRQRHYFFGDMRMFVDTLIAGH